MIRKPPRLKKAEKSSASGSGAKVHGAGGDGTFDESDDALGDSKLVEDTDGDPAGIIVGKNDIEHAG
jgi:hypothetical protein